MGTIAIVGAAGQLGTDLMRVLGAEAIALPRDVDLTRPDMLRAALESHRPAVVINCAAYNFVDRAESEPEAAFAINALGVQHLARLGREYDCALVHISSDHVFGRDAERSTAYAETDTPAPVSVYGASKLAGEYLAQLCPRHFVIRTCGLFGHAGRTSRKGNFVEMILRQIEQGKPLRVVDDQRCTPTATADLARAIVALLRSERYGLYHLTNAGDCTWHEFARAIVELSGLDVSVQAVKSATFASPAQRPGYSVLANVAAAHLGIVLRPWRDALADYLIQRRSPP